MLNTQKLNFVRRSLVALVLVPLMPVIAAAQGHTRTSPSPSSWVIPPAAVSMRWPAFWLKSCLPSLASR